MENVLILGNPNSGKTLLFNRLTGMNQKVANFPGVTVEIRSGQSDGLLFQDFPGTYSLKPLTIDERVAIDGFKSAVLNPKTRAVICVLDATRLERSLYLLLQLVDVAKKTHCPLIAAVNVIDEIVGGQIKMDLLGLSNALGCSVVGVSAKKGSGLSQLKEIYKNLPSRDLKNIPTDEAINLEQFNSTDEIIRLKSLAHELSKKYGPTNDVLLLSQHRLDNFFLSTWGGPLVFTALMLFLFQSIFSWAAPFMDGIDNLISTSGNFVASNIQSEILADFMKDAVFAGLGSFLVFAPQIFVLFLVIGVLEDSGYLARAAVILHRPLSHFGLSGRSFVTMLSGHACAIPAIMAARTIESPRKRLLTIIVTPFMSCSARLPVYALLVGGFIPATHVLGGLIGLQGLAFFGLFTIGIVTGLIASSVLDKLLSKKVSSLGDAPFLVELPPYRIPNLRPILLNAASRTRGFVQNAGFMIFSVTVVVWVLGYFPNGSGHLDSSWLGVLGRWIEPVFSPMGMDWKIGVAVLTSFLAREVFVGTLGTLYGIESLDDDMSSLSSRLHSSGMGIASALALAVFYSLAMQCVSTLAVIKKETASAKIPVYVFIGMTIIAYLGAAIVFFTTRAFIAH
ncbi:MAG: ferrous iron transporter B [Oligoflexales bacterium]|nr:ferrous iron transporter B [Oligoflexales bacterium]